MRNNFIKITLTLVLMFVMAVPAQLFALGNSQVARSIPSNYSEIYNDFIKQFNGFGLQNLTIQQTSQPTRSDQQILQAPPTQAAPAPAANAERAETAKTDTTTNTAQTEAVESPAASFGSYEQQVVDLVNKERAAVRLPALKVNSQLSAVAEKKAEDLRDKNYFDHQSPTYGSPFDMMKQFGITYTAAGENIARGQKTPKEVMNGWMNSPGHRANILNSSFTEIGVGYVTDSRGTTYWVQHFIRP